MRTVILACSATKKHRDEPDPLAAVHRYDGPAFRVYRGRWTMRRHRFGFILSAEHGLIGERAPIADYDRKMDAARSRELIDPTAEAVQRLVRSGELAGDVLFYGGQLYRSCFQQAVQLAELELERDIAIHYTAGGIGAQLGQLRRFLDGKPQ